MIELKSPREIGKMRAAGRIVALAHKEVRKCIKPGVTTEEIDHVVRDFVKSQKGSLLFFNYQGFPASTCISINEEVVHGIPSPKRLLSEGDVVSVDIGVGLDGYCGDSAWTYPVGKVSREAKRLLRVGEKSLDLAIRETTLGNRVSDIGRAVQIYVESERFSVVKKYVGHGIGRKMHEPPQVPNYVEKGFLKDDPVLKVGMVLAIEPMVNAGTEDVRTLPDKWTVVTKDCTLSVHFEHTVAVTKDGPKVLTVC